VPRADADVRSNRVIACRKLVIVGAGAFAEVACEYFNEDSDYEVIGFAVEQEHLKQEELLGLPVVPLETVDEVFPATETDAYVAVVFTQLNRLRRRLLDTISDKGFAPASYRSSAAQVAKSAALGEHCFVFENNVVQPFVSIGDNVVLWSGNHIGHHSQIKDNVFISSHVVIAGSCDIGKNTFLGVNAAVADGVTVGADCWIGPGITISSDVPARSMFGAAKSSASKADTHRFFRLKE
jgi:sugar O-acyltransferase (sialic acid O-acetyltransferase NeuD family)